MVFSEYSNFYDLYYEDKDYAAEADFILELAARFGDTPKTLLDMGCGTGRHLKEFVKQGLKCDGFDLSGDMLAQAHKRLAGTGVDLSQGNLTDFENGKQYDIVVSMFAVMGYLTDNAQLVAGLSTAQRHLKKAEFSFLTAGLDRRFYPNDPKGDVTNTRMGRIRLSGRSPRILILFVKPLRFIMMFSLSGMGRSSSKSKKIISCVLCLSRK